MGQFTKEMTVEEILKIMNDNKARTETMHAGPCFLQYKFHQELIIKQQESHKELMEIQQKFQKENLKWMTSLVFATWALVGATILLAFLNKS